MGMQDLQRYINIAVDNGCDVDKEIKIYYDFDKNIYEVEACDNVESGFTLDEAIQKQIASMEKFLEEERLIWRTLNIY